MLLLESFESRALKPVMEAGRQRGGLSLLRVGQLQAALQTACLTHPSGEGACPGVPLGLEGVQEQLEQDFVCLRLVLLQFVRDFCLLIGMKTLQRKVSSLIKDLNTQNGGSYCTFRHAIAACHIAGLCRRLRARIGTTDSSPHRLGIRGIKIEAMHLRLS